MRISTDCPRNDAVRESRIWGKSPECRQRRKREEKRCVSLNSPLVAGTMSVSARRFLQRRAEASSGAAAFAAGDASSPRASVPGDAARFSPGTAVGAFRCRIRRVPGDDWNPERTTRLDYYPDDIVPTPRHGDDTSGDEGVHPNDDPSSPTWHAAPHRSPLAFSFRGHSSSNAATKRSAPSATRRPPSIPRAGGMVVAPGPHADVLPRRHAGALRNGAFHGAGAGAPPRALRRPADDVDPAPARFPRAETENTRRNEKQARPRRRRHPPPRASLPGRPRRARAASSAPRRRGGARPRDVQPGYARGGDDRGAGGGSGGARSASRARRRRVGNSGVARVRETTRS